MDTFADIIPAAKINFENTAYTYSIPENLFSKLVPGSVVHIPFGKKNIRGIVTEVHGNNDLGSLKAIQARDNITVDKNYIEVAIWISNNYFCSLGEAISLFLPPKMPKRIPDQIKENIVRDNNKIILNTEQSEIYKKIRNKLFTGDKPSLIHGVTGSGKTEIYIKLIQEVLLQKGQVIFLVPEILLANQTIQKLEQTFSGQIATYHSGMTEKEKYLSYYEFYLGNKNILVGPRSAIGVSGKNIKLIIIDEEHDNAYKQEGNPRYHITELAERIARANKAQLVLGSATPNISAFYKTKIGTYDLYELKNRFNKLILPPTTIIDMRNEIKGGNFSPISNYLKKEIAANLKSKKQVLLFINRLGMTTFTSCRECGYVVSCPNCRLPLIQYLEEKGSYLECHHCQQKEKVPKVCPNCQSTKIKHFGAGIDKIEKSIAELFPGKRIKKVSSKLFSTHKSYQELLNNILSDQYDILIGTQILSKGLDLPNIGLVGVISADTGLNLPHFLAGEKNFQMLAQVSGRSGRREDVGETIIQTYWPESPSIKHASNHDYLSFYNYEILERKKHNYPPFSKIIRVVSENFNKETAFDKIKKVSDALSKDNLDFIGPGKCFYQRLNKKYRYHILIKINEAEELDKVFEIYRKNQYLVWDTEPTSLL